LNLDQTPRQGHPPSISLRLKPREGDIVDVFNKHQIALRGFEIFQESSMPPGPQKQLSVVFTGPFSPFLQGQRLRGRILNAETQSETHPAFKLNLVNTLFPPSSEFSEEFPGDREMRF
jgi:hypothetical protein